MDTTAEQIRDLEEDLGYLRREVEDGLLEERLGQECIQAFEERIAWKKEILAQERRAELKAIRRRPKSGVRVTLARWTRGLRSAVRLG